MTNIEKVERLKDLEKWSDAIENMLLGVDSHYFESAELTSTIQSSDFEFSNSKLMTIGVTKKLLIQYLKYQLADYQSESESILKDLLDSKTNK